MKTQISLIFLFFSLILLASPVRAGDAVVGDGTPASCTETAFDDALATANSGGGTITFNCGPGETTIPLSITKIVNLANVTINGGNQVILQAAPLERHFFAGAVTFRLQNITLTGGDSLVNGGAVEASGAEVFLENVKLLNNQSDASGGAVYCYDGTLTITDSVFDGNQAETGGAIFNDGCTVNITNTIFHNNQANLSTGRGGAVENSVTGNLTVQNSLFQTNAALDGGGLYNAIGANATLNAVTFDANSAGYGGGIENSGALTITHSLLDNNVVTGSGGGLWNIGGNALLTQTTISNNFAYEGGGISTYGISLEMRDVNIISNYANSASPGAVNGGGLHHIAGTVFITNATISGNFAQDNGGGIYQASDDNLTLTNVTVANNVVTGLGGGFYHYGRYAILTNVTLANNLAGIAGHAIYEDSPQTPSEPGVVQLVNNLIFGEANNCDGGLFQSLGHNLSQGTCASLTDPTDQDNYPGDLLVGTLTFNGGTFPMNTIMPQAGSPLIDAGDPAACIATDQRGASRVGTCDLGAVEYGAMVPRVYLPLVQK
ncbi:MAG: hypothetical protein H6636_11870 [Anaerolineales bacterium]|nr:hypothetical protein [Anaerolineales bacterium]